MIFLILPFCIHILLFQELVNGDTTNNGTNLQTLRQVHAIFRHGDRAPFMKAPIDPVLFDKTWTTGLSALQDEGKRRALKLGQFIRTRYDGFVGASYKQKEISVQTSYVDRTIMTGLTALAGMFPVTNGLSWSPEINWQPVPIRTVDSKVDNFIGSTAPCPRWKQLKKEFFTVTEFAKKINSENQELYDYVQNNTGYPVNNFEDISDLFDTLTIQKSNGYPVPEWSETVWDEMAALFPLPYDSRVLVPTQEAKRLRIGPLFTKIIKNLDTVVQDSEPVKMHWIVGHDWSIAGFLGALDMFETHFPAFTSAVFIELHEQTSSQAAQSNTSTFVVKIFYRKTSEDAAVEQKIPACADPCPLDQFKSITQDFMLEDEQWAEACQSQPALESTATQIMFFSGGQLWLLVISIMAFVL